MVELSGNGQQSQIGQLQYHISSLLQWHCISEKKKSCPFLLDIMNQALETCLLLVEPLLITYLNMSMCKSPICSFNPVKLLFVEAWASCNCENPSPELFTMWQYINSTILLKNNAKSEQSMPAPPSCVNWLGVNANR